MELLEGEAEFTKEKVEDEMELRECNETNAIYLQFSSKMFVLLKTI